MWLCMALFVVLAYLAFDRIMYRNFYRAKGNCPGPRKWFPVIGTISVFLSVENPKDFFIFVIDLWKKYGPILQLTFLRRMVYMISSHKDIEVVLSSTTILKKGRSYDFTIPWIGRGLLTSDGAKWKSRRKMLTPAFHFKIVNEFVHIFNKNGLTLCELLDKEVNSGPFDVHPYMRLVALDNIYETAMGVSRNIQRTPDAKFVRAIRDICSLINERAFSPFLRLEFFYRFSSSYKIGRETIAFLHHNTENLIKERRGQIASDIAEMETKGDGFEGKKRFAFLDLLLMEAANCKLDDSDIREEVDTFLFEGHDTVTSGLSFCAHQLAQHPEIQEKAYQEQFEIFGDSDRSPTFNELQEMKYLECVIKESQRLYPSVPIIERCTHEPITLSGNVKVPEGSQLMLFLYALHRDPEVWNDPDTFNPDNFSSEACWKRHPYAYVPFSAGPRNCIGQRFAMMELKSTISIILRRFRLLPSLRPEHKLHLTVELVLNSKTGHHIQLQRRI